MGTALGLLLEHEESGFSSWWGVQATRICCCQLAPGGESCPGKKPPLRRSLTTVSEHLDPAVPEG